MKSHSKLLLLAVSSFFATETCISQVYNVKAKAGDLFSENLVALLNSAPDNFGSFRGGFLHTSYMSEDVYALDLEFPGSRSAVISSRDNNTNVYIEFQGFMDSVELNNGIYKLRNRIRIALGDQLFDKNHDSTSLWRSFTGFSVRDENGFYNMNLELFAGRTSFDSYLLSPQKESGTGTKFFILMKIYAGTPSYYHFIRPGLPPEQELHESLVHMLAASKNDFSELRSDTLQAKPKRLDTIYLKGYGYYMHYGGSNYSATLGFLSGQERFSMLHKALQAALGSSYVFHRYQVNGKEAILYFASSHDPQSPRVYLNFDESEKFLYVRIYSNSNHPVKRHLEMDDH